ncbi:MAG: GNAT family N-acetyltransferase [Proteobacteria bacterium]|nr:GNAT family N-acetyltransferase [Pseudomonadota bacterium]
MKIRKAIQSDAANLAALGTCVWVDTYATQGVFEDISKYVFSELVTDRILALIGSKDIFVIQNENSLLGYIVLDSEKEKKVEIETLYILPRFQGQGLGRKLIEKAKEAVTVPLWLSVWDKNLKAINFYQRLGFEERGEICFDLYGTQIRNIVLKMST